MPYPSLNAFSDKTTFHILRPVSLCSFCIWGWSPPSLYVQQEEVHVLEICVNLQVMSAFLLADKCVTLQVMSHFYWQRKL